MADNPGPDFVPSFQIYASILSLANALILLSLGSFLFLIPQTVVHILLDFDNDELALEHEVIFSVTRMAGGVLLAQSFSCLLLLFPMLVYEFGNSNLRPASVTMARTSIAVQSVTGLFWVVAGLLDDRVNESSGIRRRETFGLLVVGFFILIISCLALMLSFWPVDHYSTNEPSQSTSIMEPLLAGQSNQDQEGQQIQEVEEEPAYRLLEEDPEQSLADETNNNDSDGDSSEQQTSRIRGTRRLLKLASPQLLYLWIGCITLLIRLPFSLSIPHFVSTTLGAVSQGQFDRARREVFWLFLLGTIDACLDFWCIFWFGYANLRIVRGVRIDTFAAILRQEMGFHDKHTSGELASRLNSDCGAMASGK